MYDSHTGHPYANQYWGNNSINQTHKNKNFGNPNYNGGQGRSQYENGGSRSRSREKFGTNKDSFPHRDFNDTYSKGKVPNPPDAANSGPGTNLTPAPPKTFPGLRSDSLDSPSPLPNTTSPTRRGQQNFQPPSNQAYPHPQEVGPPKSPYPHPAPTHQKPTSNSIYTQTAPLPDDERNKRKEEISADYEPSDRFYFDDEKKVWTI